MQTVATPVDMAAFVPQLLVPEVQRQIHPTRSGGGHMKVPTAAEIQLRIDKARRRVDRVHGAFEASFMCPFQRAYYVAITAYMIENEAALAFEELRADIERILTRD